MIAKAYFLSNVKGLYNLPVEIYNRVPCILKSWAYTSPWEWWWPKCIFGQIKGIMQFINWNL